MSHPMIKPQQVDSLPFLDAQQKMQYKNGLANLWQQHDNNPEGSQGRTEARQKLITASNKIMQQIAQKTRSNGATGPPQRPPQPQPTNQTQIQPQNTQKPTLQEQAQPQQSGDPDAALKAKISAEVNAVVVAPTAATTTQAQFEQHKQNFKTQLGTYKFKAAKARDSLQQLTAIINQTRANKQDPSQEMLQKATQFKTVWEQFMTSADRLMQENVANMKSAQQRRDQAARFKAEQQANSPRSQTQEGSSPAPVNTQPRMPQVNQSRPVNQQPIQQPQRPPMNPQAQQYGSQYNGAPNSAIPQTANPIQRPHALSQQGAIAKAQEQNFQQTGPQPQVQQAPPVNNGFNQVPPQGTPTAVTPNQTPQPLNNKFPIPKNLNLGPQTQMPVAGPGSRPTILNHGGMMAMPGVQKPPPFNLEGEGEHVLSKRKLDELVRQVTGSTNPADGLTPEVEEAVLSMTDDFVDNVITKACQLAKLRTGQTLDIRDIQIVLERNYGIRIPGYSLDEVRTVRKFQPGAGWIAKVQAVQAGKVMGNNKDA